MDPDDGFDTQPPLVQKETDLVVEHGYVCNHGSMTECRDVSQSGSLGLMRIAK